MKDFWKRKLAAYLHDPPSKPLNLKEHGEIAESLLHAAGFEDPSALHWFFDKACDHTAAAADRLAFPHPRVLACAFTGGPDSPFHHPLGGGRLRFNSPITAAQAEEAICKAQPAYKHITEQVWADETERWRVRFFLHWRLWRQAASISRNGERGDGRLALLPADTRIPDHSTWMHCALVSALQACVEIEERDGGGEVRAFQPAFLLVQIGPVQQFIAQARSTRDLWSGSYLLSWLVATGLKAITDQCGPDCALFPSLWGQPLFDFLHRDEIFLRIKTDGEKRLWDEIRPSDEQILTPNLPNRFLVLVPYSKAEQLAKTAEAAMRRMLIEEIGGACLEWFKKLHHSLPEEAHVRWRQQLCDFLEVHWQVWPWETDVGKAIAAFERLPAGEALNDLDQTTSGSVRAAYEAARRGIPTDQLDPRNYRHENTRTAIGFSSKVLLGPDGFPVVENLGFAWAAHYAQTDFLLAARRQTREFSGWGDPEDEGRLRGASRDQLSGKEEIVGPLDWEGSLHKLPHHLFRPGELLGAMNLLKRVWHVAYLDEKRGLTRKRLRFDSVSAVAAAPFVSRVLERTPAGPARDLFIDHQRGFGPLASEARGFFGGIADWEQSSEEKWLEETDSSVFHLSEWDRAISEEEKRSGGPRSEAIRKLKEARDALGRLLGRDGLNCKPSSYYAVLALDGDEMGKWVSGAKSPVLRDQLADKAREHFERHQADAADPGALKRLLDQPRHLSPSYHLQFSEALGNFSVYLAPAIVEFYDGQLIYAGGDDVLAMLPAANAVACAGALRLAFRGEAALIEHLKKHQPSAPHVPVLTVEDGFVSLNGEWEGFKRYQRFLPRGVHLLVPGPRATVSVGVAIGHIREPLQDMVREAQAAEKRAKAPPERSSFDRKKNATDWKPNEGWDRDALAVTLFKRSGETIHWGAKFNSPAFDLLELFQRHYRVPLENPRQGMPVTGKFPYRVAELLGRFEASAPVTAELCQIAKAEFTWITQQQIRRVGPIQSDGALAQLRQDLCQKAAAYLDHLLNFQWERPTADGNKQRVTAPRPLREFIHLFALEAFIARTGE